MTFATGFFRIYDQQWGQEALMLDLPCAQKHGQQVFLLSGTCSSPGTLRFVFREIPALPQLHSGGSHPSLVKTGRDPLNGMTTHTHNELAAHGGSRRASQQQVP